MTHPLATVGISGPDGSGKTTLVRGLRAELAASGVRVHATYLYGCVACRRARPRVTVDSAREPRRAERSLLAIHGAVDLAELVVRLVPLRLLAYLEARSGRPTVVLADRSPLDGLAKHQRVADGAVGWAFRRTARWFDRLILLDADGATLAARDGEHGPEELEGWRRRLRHAARGLPQVRLIEATALSTGEVLAAVLPLALPPGPAGAAGRPSA